MDVTFHGVRGSTPTCSSSTQRYGGNTSCVAIDAAGAPPILLDLGTGLRGFGQTFDGPFRGTMFVTHLHWDHIQGLPFFGPMLCEGSEAVLYGPPQEAGPLRDVLAACLRPPYFPIPLDDLPCTIAIEEIDRASVEVGSAVVTARRVPHPGPTNGYRVDHLGSSVAYIPDHQEPPDGAVDPAVLELVAGVDLLIHDAQYTVAEFETKRHWGHCTLGYALTVAVAAGASRLALFHHDPSHGDDMLDVLAVEMASLAAASGIELVVAAEGTTIEL